MGVVHRFSSFSLPIDQNYSPQLMIVDSWYANNVSSGKAWTVVNRYNLFKPYPQFFPIKNKTIRWGRKAAFFCHCYHWTLHSRELKTSMYLSPEDFQQFYLLDSFLGQFSLLLYSTTTSSTIIFIIVVTTISSNINFRIILTYKAVIKFCGKM